MREYEVKLKKLNQELQEKVEELEKWKKMTIGRELNMIEIKEENKKARKEIKKRNIIGLKLDLFEFLL